MAYSSIPVRPSRLTVGRCDQTGKPMLEAFIKARGQELQIYSEERGDERTQGHVISEIGQTRRCKLPDCDKAAGNLIHEHVYPHFMVSWYIDGKYRGSRLVNSANGSPFEKAVDIDLVSVAVGMMGTPVFSTPVLVEDAARLPRKDAAAIGTITIIVQRVLRKGDIEDPVTPTATTEADGKAISPPINEKDKKAQMGSITIFADVKPDSSIKVTADGSFKTFGTADIHPDDTLEEPFYTFKFVYRPEDLLQAQGKLNDGEYEDIKPVIPANPPAQIIDLGGDNTAEDIKSVFNKAKRSKKKIVIDLVESSDEDESADETEEVGQSSGKSSRKMNCCSGCGKDQKAQMQQNQKQIAPPENQSSSGPKAVTRFGLKRTFSKLLNVAGLAFTFGSGFGSTSGTAGQQASLANPADIDDQEGGASKKRKL